MDLLLWKKEKLESYPIDLGDLSIVLPVVMMDDFITFGWLGYATFNYKYTGGWADHSKLHCVKPAYELDSEKFRVSYLAHEGRHYSDYTKFPKLEAADLEYRAKLTELSLAKMSLKALLQHFADEAAPGKSSAHAYASYQVVQNISAKMGHTLNPSEIAKLDENQLRSMASDLLKKHSLQLEALGAASTKGIYQ